MSGVMYRSGSQHLLLDNTGRLRYEPLIPPIGFRITFSTIDVLFAVAPPSVYPRVVHDAEDPPCYKAARGRRTDRPESCEVMATPGPATEADAAEVEAEGGAQPSRTCRSKPPYERPENCEEQVGT